MTPDERFPDDVVLRRVAALCPPIREDDLSPFSARAAAIAERVLRTSRPTDVVRPRPSARPHRSRHPGGRSLLLATLGTVVAMACAAVIVLVVAPSHRSPTRGGRVAADLIDVHIVTALESRSLRFDMARTPLGARIEHEHQGLLQDIQTGTAAENASAITRLAHNERACARAASVIARVRARPAQHAAQRDWIEGVRLQATGDRQLIAALRAVDSGHVAAGRRDLTAALDALDRGDGLTGHAENALVGNPGPSPRGD